MSNRKKYYFCFFIIIPAIFCCYACALNAPFIFDDLFIIEELKHNTILQLMSPLAGLRPFYKASLKINYLISGLHTWSYHLLNIFIHILNTCLIFEIIRRTLLLDKFKDQFRKNALILSFTAALVWGLHPLQTQAVTYIAQRCEIMMAMFYLISLLLLILSSTSRKKSILYQLLALITFCLGLGSKEAMISAPLVLLLYDRIFLSETLIKALQKHRIYYLGIGTIFITPLIYISSAGNISDYISYITGRHGIEPSTYLLTQSAVWLHYIQSSFVPTYLCFDYDWVPSKNISEVVVPLSVLTVFSILLIKLIRKNIYLAFPLLFCIINLLPRSLVTSTHAAVDYRMYLPSAGLFFFYVFVVFLFLQHLKQINKNSSNIINTFSCIVPAMIIIFLFTVSFNMNNLYNTPLKLWEKTVSQVPHNAGAWNYYGIALSEKQRFYDAELCFKKSLSLVPGNMIILNNLANVYIETGKTEKAIPLYYESLSHRNDSKDMMKNFNSITHHNLAKIFASKGNFTKAAYHYLEAIRLAPDNTIVIDELASLFQKAGYHDEAQKYFSKVLALDKNFYQNKFKKANKN